jgi:L-histidine N-alpha-methyltransferase
VSFRLERLLGPDDLAEALRREAREGLNATPKRMRSRWIWDARGSELYEQIMELPDYYLPRCERAILEACAGELAALVRPETVLELGSGSSSRTKVLLDALDGLRRFVAVDVSESALAEAGARLAARYPGLEVVGVVADFERHLNAAPREGRTLAVCLGSTIGALDPDDRAVLLSASPARSARAARFSSASTSSSRSSGSSPRITTPRACQQRWSRTSSPS